MDRVPLSHIIQLGEFGCLPRDILARKHERGLFGVYVRTHDYYPFDAKLGEIVFDLEGVGGNPTALARTMLAWWKPARWSVLDDRIFRCLSKLFYGHKKLSKLLPPIRGNGKGVKVITELALLVLTKVEERNPDKQMLVIQILGEFLGAKHVSYGARSVVAEGYTRTCIFGDHLWDTELFPKMAKLKIEDSDLEAINEVYRETLRVDDLKKRQLTVLQTFLEHFVKLNSAEVYHTIRTLEEKSFNGLWRHCKDIRDGKIRSDFWSECHDKLFADGCFDTNNICGNCWITEHPVEEVGAELICKRHKKTKEAVIIESSQLEENPQVLPSAPPLEIERQVMVSSAIVELKQVPPSAPPVEESQDDIARECGVCFKPFDCVLVPCGHVCCMVCSEQLKICHLCRGPINIRQRIRF
jgi:hypothetical protein